MPELPEVETVRRGLEPVLVGARFARVERRRADLRIPFPARFEDRLAGARIDALTRRAKYIVAHLDSGEALVVHLGMSGRFSITRPGAGSRSATAAYVHETGSDPAHDHVVFHMEGGAVVTYNDPRRFGLMTLVPGRDLDADPLFAGLGPEPLGNAFTTLSLALAAAGRRVDLKSLLLDQRTVAGLGNIYVAEALFRAGLSPKRAARTLADRRGGPTERTERLVREIRAVLADAIRAGGSTLRDYRHADGAPGTFQQAFRVYDREGEPCPAAGCGGLIRRIVQAGRSTFYCPACQR